LAGLGILGEHFGAHANIWQSLYATKYLAHRESSASRCVCEDIDVIRKHVPIFNSHGTSSPRVLSIPQPPWNRV